MKAAASAVPFAVACERVDQEMSRAVALTRRATSGNNAAMFASTHVCILKGAMVTTTALGARAR
jgi:hypothetical protein